MISTLISTDLLQLQRGFGTTGSDARQVMGDADWNDVIDAADLAVWQQEFGSSMETFAGASTGAAILAVPEPAALSLWVGAWAVLLGRRSRQRRK